MASSVCDNAFRILLVGKTGAGKSSTGNSILGRRVFESALSSTSVTKEIKVGYNDVRVKEDGCEITKRIIVVDGPGLADTRMRDDECVEHVSEQMKEAVAQCPDGYDAILIVIQLTRLTNEDGRTINQLDGIFGDRYVMEYGILVVTRGEDYDEEENGGMSFEEWCGQQDGIFQELRKRCRGRVILFQNRTRDPEVKEEQLEKLFDLISQMKQNLLRYTPELFQNAQAARDKMLLESKVPVIKQKTEAELSLVIQAIKNLKCESRSDVPVLRQNRAKIDELIKDIKEQDKGTGVLSELISTLENVGGIIDDRISLVEIAEHDREKEQRLEQQMETYRQKLEDLEKRENDRRVQIVLNVMKTVVPMVVSAVAGITSIVKTGIQIHKLRKGN